MGTSPAATTTTTTFTAYVATVSSIRFFGVVAAAATREHRCTAVPREGVNCPFLGHAVEQNGTATLWMHAQPISPWAEAGAVPLICRWIHTTSTSTNISWSNCTTSPHPLLLF
jgi:hypothetical protein